MAKPVDSENDNVRQLNIAFDSALNSILNDDSHLDDGWLRKHRNLPKKKKKKQKTEQEQKPNSK